MQRHPHVLIKESHQLESGESYVNAQGIEVAMFCSRLKNFVMDVQ
jgi:hypothetical protein